MCLRGSIREGHQRTYDRRATEEIYVIMKQRRRFDRGAADERQQRRYGWGAAKEMWGRGSRSDVVEKQKMGFRERQQRRAARGGGGDVNILAKFAGQKRRGLSLPTGGEG
jgi:hypothetical protein